MDNETLIHLHETLKMNRITESIPSRTNGNRDDAVKMIRHRTCHHTKAFSPLVDHEESVQMTLKQYHMLSISSFLGLSISTLFISEGNTKDFTMNLSFISPHLLNNSGPTSQLSAVFHISI